MLFFKALFVTSLLIFGLVQCSVVPISERPSDTRKGKGATSAELLDGLVKKHVSEGLKNHKHSVRGLESPEIKAILRGASEYVVIQLDIAEEEAKKLMKDVDGISATLFGHREASQSDLNIENAARFFIISLVVSIIRMTIKSALRLFKSPLSQRF